MAVTLIEIIRTLDKEPAAVIAAPVQQYDLKRGDVVFYAGRWRKFDKISAYRMKENNRLWLSAFDFSGNEYFKSFLIPKYETLLRRIA